jgi:hypothetical protein
VPRSALADDIANASAEIITEAPVKVGRNAPGGHAQ